MTLNLELASTLKDTQVAEMTTEDAENIFFNAMSRRIKMYD